MAYDISHAFESIENELIDSMMRNFSRHRAEETKEGYNWSQWQAEQLQSLEQYRKKNYKKFGKRFSEINGKVEEMLRTARADGNTDQEAKILEAIQNGFKVTKMPPASSTAEFFKVNDRKLNALINATTNDLQRAETAILRMSNDKYRQAIFNAQVYANSGAGTYEKAVDMACRDMLRAGLNCIEYKNGARHTLSDYAEMAIRTANKRAYLRGEGEKRKEFGITTVVVNSRQGGCPDCAVYIGRVFIDDVYSGGKKSDGNYPLLSEAIKGGLFHPRCKDSTSTYYEGITTLKPVTPEERKEMAKREALETRRAYCENEGKKCQRIADYSLDSDNQRAYQHRADVWEDKAEVISNKVDSLDNVGNIANKQPKVSANMTVAKSGESGISGSKLNANYVNTVDLEYISSEEYHSKFKGITGVHKVDEQIYSQSKAMLVHRNKTDKEDMCLIDSRTGTIAGRQTHSKSDFGVDYNNSLNNAIANNPRNVLISLHNHPTNNPPTGSDFVTNGAKGYKFGVLVTHNGKVFTYKAGNKIFSSKNFDKTVDKYRGVGYNYNEYEAIINTLKQYAEEYGIEWSER